MTRPWHTTLPLLPLTLFSLVASLLAGCNQLCPYLPCDEEVLIRHCDIDKGCWNDITRQCNSPTPNCPLSHFGDLLSSADRLVIDPLKASATTITNPETLKDFRNVLMTCQNRLQKPWTGYPVGSRIFSLYGHGGLVATVEVGEELVNIQTNGDFYVCPLSHGHAKLLNKLLDNPVQ